MICIVFEPDRKPIIYMQLIGYSGDVTGTERRVIIVIIGECMNRVAML